MSERRAPEPSGLPQVDAEKNAAFFDAAFGQVKENPLRAKRKTGSFFKQLFTLWETQTESLRAREIKVNTEDFAYVTPDSVDSSVIVAGGNFYIASKTAVSEKEKLIKDAKIKLHLATESLTTNTIGPRMKEQVVKPGVLAEPATYYRQEHPRTCFLANFNMIYTAITGRSINEETVLDAAAKHGLLIKNRRDAAPQPLTPERETSFLQDIDEDVLLATLQTPAFTEEFGDIKVGIVKMIGADFADIEELTDMFKTRAAEIGCTMDAYVVPMFASEVNDNGIHNGILLAADAETVTLHDPSKAVDKMVFRGYACKQFPKESFVRLWARKGLRSTYVAVFKPLENEQGA